MIHQDVYVILAAEKPWGSLFGGFFLLGLFVAVIGVRITIQISNAISESKGVQRRMPQGWFVVVSLVAALLATPAAFVSSPIVTSFGYVSTDAGFIVLGIAMVCSAVASSLMTLALMWAREPRWRK